MNRSNLVLLAVVAAVAAVPAALGRSAAADDRAVDRLPADASPPDEEGRETASGGGASDDASAAPATEDAGPPVIETWRPPRRLPPVGLEVGFDALYQGFTPGGSVALGPTALLLLPPRRRWGLRAAASFGLRSEYAYEHDINLRMAFTHVRVAACATPTDKHVRGLLCLGGLYGVLDASGETYEGRRGGGSVTAGPFGQLQLGVGGEGIFFHVGLDVVVPTSRASYELSFPAGVSASDHPFKTPAVVEIVEIGISLRLR
jgi:hypothetical protein